MKNKYYINVIIGAVLWGIIGIFVKELYILQASKASIILIQNEKKKTTSI